MTVMQLLKPREAARAMNLQKGDTGAALIKSTEVMLIRP